jgi:putative transposase
LLGLLVRMGFPYGPRRGGSSSTREAGLVGLVRRRRADCGKRRMPSALQQLIEGLALQKPAPTAAMIHRQVTVIAEQQGWSKPSYSLVYSVVQSLDPGMVTLAHEGSKAYREAFDLIYRREAQRPNEIWQADHTLLDIWVTTENGAPSHPWLTVILDDYSRAVAGYFLSFQAPSALNTALALRQAIWRKADPRWHVCGIPETFYTDHGSDFTSQHMEQVAADLKMTLVFSTKGMPRGRGKMERFFQTVNQMLLGSLPGYAPEGAPPPACRLLSLAELETRLHAFILDEYQIRVHGGTDMAPQVRWEAGGFLPQIPETLEQLDLLLLTVAKARRVHPDGIRFQGLRYIDLTLAAFVGEDVIVRYDPRDLAEIRVYHHGKFLCRAVSQELSGQTVSIKEIERARNQRRKQLREGITQRATLVDSLLAVHKPPDTAIQKEQPQEPPTQEPPAQQKRLRRYYND